MPPSPQHHPSPSLAIPGLNQIEGLQRVAGNQTLYRQLLIRFRESQAQVENQLNNALSNHDMKRATQLLHSIKGVAGNIGAQSLQRSAEALEQAVIAGAPSQQLSPLTTTFTTHLTQLLKALEKVQAVDTPRNSTASEPHHSIDAKQVRPLLIKLAQHLANSSLEADPVMEAMQKQLQFTQAEPVRQEIEKCMANYDFKSARNHLDILAAVLNISL